MRSDNTWSSPVTTPYISHLHFQVEHTDALPAFYRDVLGMRAQLHGRCCEFSFPNSRTAISFSPGATAPYQYSGDDWYWKIGVTVPDLTAAIDYLRDRGQQTSEPQQFKDIGYMAHLRDPCGFNIELLQHGFAGEEQSVGDKHPLAANATLAHLTLRVLDLQAAQRYFVDKLGMRLISVQPVPDYHFCLYFFTWHQEPTPVPELDAVENRSWLWRRPYLMVEIQHLHNKTTPLLHHADNSCRFNGFSYIDRVSKNVTLDTLAVVS